MYQAQPTVSTMYKISKTREVYRDCSEVQQAIDYLEALIAEDLQNPLQDSDRDYKDMRRFQEKFIKADQELRELRAAIEAEKGKEITDRQLLNMAAKAAGYWSNEFSCVARLPKLSWDPLIDDGDAFRLAIKLDIDVCSNIAMQANANECWEFLHDHLDKYSATRRAIVRAAADIGANLK